MANLMEDLSQTETRTPVRAPRRRPRARFLALLLLPILIVAGIFVYLHFRDRVSSDDANVDGRGCRGA